LSQVNEANKRVDEKKLSLEVTFAEEDSELQAMLTNFNKEMEGLQQVTDLM
jgi:hypothetical protein